MIQRRRRKSQRSLSGDFLRTACFEVGWKIVPRNTQSMTTDSIQSLESSAAQLPPIIQGGMGVGVSGWRLANAVAREGQLGVVSGTAMDVVITRQLQLGDIGGHLRRALAAFPYPEIANRILEKYFIPGGKAAEASFKTPSMVSHEPSRATRELVMASSFTAIHLAKEGHSGVVGLNLLEKIS
jgi:NAD(P)H-dependent flavin oxidoreductase YrpB (nitropropane dioxygenase family)